MKRYGLWKYFLILFVLGFGIVYSLPNLYSPDPAVQVSYTSSSQTADIFLADRIKDIVQDQDLKAQIELENDYVLVRTDTYQNQLKLKELLSNNLVNDVVIALNLAPTTPKWLEDIGANPMKLGLDLRGGVHFLMQVDTESAIKNRQDGTLQDLRIRFREEKIRYSQATVEDDASIFLKFNSQEAQKQAEDFLNENYTQFNLPLISNEENSLQLKLSDIEIEQIESDAIDQNLTTLRYPKIKKDIISLQKWIWCSCFFTGYSDIGWRPGSDCTSFI